MIKVVTLFAAVCIYTGVLSQENPENSGQPKELNDTQKYCLQGIRNAQIDFEAGDYKIPVYGFIHIEDKKFDDFYRAYLQEKYNITFLYPQDMTSTEMECYTGRMKSMIFKEFGDDFFEKVNNEAKVAYENSN